jgi:2-phosphoglycerate kinase
MIDGTRRILQIAELPHFGLEDTPRFEVIYRFVKDGDAGWFEATGVVPRVVEKMAVYDSMVATELFDPELTRTPVTRRKTATGEQSAGDREAVRAQAEGPQ